MPKTPQVVLLPGQKTAVVVKPIVKKRKTRKMPAPQWGGFPQSQVKTLRYCDGFTLNPGAATLGYYAFKANSIFDPNHTNGGGALNHQPQGHDTFAGLYERYVVRSSKIKAWLSPQGAGDTLIATGITVDNDGSTIGNTIDMVERGGTKYKLTCDAQNSIPGGIIKHTASYNPKKCFDITDIKDNMDWLGALFGADPAHCAYFVIWIGDVLMTGDLEALNIFVQIDYEVEMSEPKDQNHH